MGIRLRVYSFLFSPFPPPPSFLPLFLPIFLSLFLHLSSENPFVGVLLQKSGNTYFIKIASLG